MNTETLRVTNPLRFRVPEELDEIDLSEPPVERMERTWRTCATLPDVTLEQARWLAMSQEISLAGMESDGAVYIANCVARSERNPRRLGTAQFAVFVKDAELQGNRPLIDVASGLRIPGQPREVFLSSYPAGDAVVVGEQVVVRSMVTPMGRRQEQFRSIRQAQIIFAFPGNGRVAILSVGSENFDDWDMYVSILNAIAQSLSFTAGGRSTISGRLDGLV